MRRGEDLGPDDRDRNRDQDRDRGAEGREPPPPPPPRAGVTPRQVLIAILALLLVAFAIANFDPVEVNFLLFETRARIITVIVVAGILGFLIGYAVGRPTRDERRWLRKREDD